MGQSYAAAQRLVRNFRRRLNRLRDKVRNGDDQAALDIIRVLTQQNNALHEIGWDLDNRGRLRHWTMELRMKKLLDADSTDRLRRQARNGNIRAARELVRRLDLEC